MNKKLRLPEKTTLQSEQRTRRYNIVAMITFSLGLLFSLLIWQLTRQAVVELEKSRFEHNSEMIKAIIEERVDEYVAALRGLRAFIDSSEQVTRNEWRTYIKDLNIDHHFKGSLGFSFIRYLRRTDLDGFVEENRDDAPDFAVVSSGNKAELFVVERIQPFERNRTLLGFDLAQDEALFEIMAQSVSTRHAALSQPTSLVTGGDGPPGVLMVLPVYQKSSHNNPGGGAWENLRGWVGASILVGEMIAGLDQYFESPLDIEVLDTASELKPYIHYDADKKPRRIESGNRDASHEMISTASIEVANRIWTLNIYALPGFSGRIASQMPNALLVAGFLLSLLSALQVASYGRTTVRAQELATQMTKKLRASEERFHKMFQEHGAVMLLVDPETQQIVDANEAACRFYGYQKEKIIALPIAKINTLPADRTAQAMQQVKEKRRSHFEFRHALSSGETRDVEIYSSPIVIDGQPLLFSVIHDITGRKYAERELAKYRENLESLVDEQTRKLKAAHAELLQQERLATLGKLTATVSHELRNPLATIKSALFLIETSLERLDPSLANRPLELAERSIDRCVTIIEELNSFARVKELKISETCLDEWLKGVIEELNPPDQINIEAHLSSGIRGSFDQEKLRQVVVNLVSNAIDAIQEKGLAGGSLKIAARRLNDKYEIRVTDNGVGMSDEVKKNIFEPFYSTKGFGVGIGMVIVKNIVEQHHGEVIIDSQEGLGTTVRVCLPMDA